MFSPLGVFKTLFPTKRLSILHPLTQKEVEENFLASQGAAFDQTDEGAPDPRDTMPGDANEVDHGAGIAPGR